jgi:predicted GIY-YIG superfamily endonuclease
MPLISSVPFLLSWVLLVPSQSGIYLISDERGLLYLGRSENLHQRFEQHYLGSHNKGLAEALANPVGQTEFRWACLNYVTSIKIERHLIKRLHPLYNRQHNGPLVNRQNPTVSSPQKTHTQVFEQPSVHYGSIPR